MPALAFKNLFEDRGRFIVALAGIMFAVALIAIQSGVFNGFVKSAGILIDESSADIWVSAREMRFLELTLPLPYDDVKKAQRVAGVDRAEAMVIKTSVFRGPSNRIEIIRVVGFDPDGVLFQPGSVDDGDLHKLRAPNTILVDRANLSTLNLPGVGGYGVIGPATVRCVAVTSGTQPIVSATFIFASLRNQRVYLSQPAPVLQLPIMTPFSAITVPFALGSQPTARALEPSDQINYVLIRAKPGADIAALQGRLESALPGTRAYTRTEMADITRAYWRQRTGLGFVLGLGAIVGVIVGMVVAGQILYTSVSDNIKEYGTMKAMGASDWTLYGIIALQALLMAAFGYLPGIALSYWVASYAMAHRGILILISPQTAALIFVITAAMCAVSAIFAMQRVTRLDPAVVFKA